VVWGFPSPNRFKVNPDGTFRDSSSSATCDVICRGCMGEYIGGFSTYLGESSLYDEFMGVILTIEEASKRNYNTLWLENVSFMVCIAFHDSKLVS